MALPVESRDKRRPRTCFYSAEREDGSQIDVVWKCGNGNVVAECSADQSPKPLKGKKQMASPKSAVTADSALNGQPIAVNGCSVVFTSLTQDCSLRE